MQQLRELVQRIDSVVIEAHRQIDRIKDPNWLGGEGNGAGRGADDGSRGTSE